MSDKVYFANVQDDEGNLLIWTIDDKTNTAIHTGDVLARAKPSTTQSPTGEISWPESIDKYIVKTNDTLTISDVDKVKKLCNCVTIGQQNRPFNHEFFASFISKELQISPILLHEVPSQQKEESQLEFSFDAIIHEGISPSHWGATGVYLMRDDGMSTMTGNNQAFLGKKQTMLYFTPNDAYRYLFTLNNHALVKAKEAVIAHLAFFIDELITPHFTKDNTHRQCLGKFFYEAILTAMQDDLLNKQVLALEFMSEGSASQLFAHLKHGKDEQARLLDEVRLLHAQGMLVSFKLHDEGIEFADEFQAGINWLRNEIDASLIKTQYNKLCQLVIQCGIERRHYDQLMGELNVAIRNKSDVVPHFECLSALINEHLPLEKLDKPTLSQEIVTECIKRLKSKNYPTSIGSSLFDDSEDLFFLSEGPVLKTLKSELTKLPNELEKSLTPRKTLHQKVITKITKACVSSVINSIEQTVSELNDNEHSGITPKRRTI